MSSAADIKRLNAVLAKVLDGMKPPEDVTVTEWAEKHRKLSSESSAEVGTWRTSRTPYLREPMNAFCDPKIHHLVMVAASQVGKSELMNNCMGYIIDCDPGSILFIQPTTVDAKEYSKLRIAPMIRDCPTLRRRVADPKSRDSSNTILQKSYPGGILTMCGSTEAHALASKPIRLLPPESVLKSALGSRLRLFTTASTSPYLSQPSPLSRYSSAFFLSSAGSFSPLPEEARWAAASFLPSSPIPDAATQKTGPLHCVGTSWGM